MKTCRHCKETKPLSEFGNRTQSADGKHFWCKQCCYVTNAEWKRNNRHVMRRYAFKSTYNIEPETYQEMYDTQKGQCFTCLAPMRSALEPDTKRDEILYYDHDHVTGSGRGLLCSSCNTALGMVHDNISTLERMITYLKGGRCNGKGCSN